MFNYRNPFGMISPMQRRPYNYYGFNDNSNITQKVNISKKIDDNIEEKKRIINNKEEAETRELLFEIFGLKIYFDDLLIVLILLFLYEEGIQDQYLFISLVLLLLS